VGFLSDKRGTGFTVNVRGMISSDLTQRSSVAEDWVRGVAALCATAPLR
jgi:hypothetical protein